MAALTATACMLALIIGATPVPDKTLLRRAWDNMQARVRGRHFDGCGGARWAGLEVEWQSFHEFRDWAYGAGWLPGLVP